MLRYIYSFHNAPAARQRRNTVFSFLWVHWRAVMIRQMKINEHFKLWETL